MAIKSIRVNNFKSFKNACVELDKLNILIGANASGKSNFLQILRFLKDIENQGLENAISLQGGIEYLINTRLGTSQNLEFELVLDTQFGNIFRTHEKDKLFAINKTIYKFSINFDQQDLKFKIVKDELRQTGSFYQLDGLNLQHIDEEVLEEDRIVSQGEIIISKSKSSETTLEINYNLHKGEDIQISSNILDILRSPFMRFKNGLNLSNILLLEHPLFKYLIPNEFSFFGNLSIYDFDPKVPKKATPITGKAELEEDGSNLAIVLKNISNDSEKKRKFSNLLREVLSFVKDFDIETFVDKSLILKLREIYLDQNNFIPASLISDGTINIIALITALYFEDKPLVVIEEPERNIHPYLISKVVEMMKEVSEHKQIITTTHNPEIVKYADLDNLILISRDKEGFSQISRPIEKEEVKIFLENEIGIDELYVQNLLKG